MGNCTIVQCHALYFFLVCDTGQPLGRFCGKLRAIMHLVVEPDHYLVKKEEDETSGSSTNVLSSTDYTLFYIQSVIAACIIAYCIRKIYTSVRLRSERMNRYNFSLQSATTAGSQSSRNSPMNEVVHDTMVQSYLYVGSYLLSFGLTAIVHLFWTFLDLPASYPTLIITGILLSPSQGF